MHTGVTIGQVGVVFLQPVHRAPLENKLLLFHGADLNDDFLVLIILGLHLAPAWRIFRHYNITFHV